MPLVTSEFGQGAGREGSIRRPMAPLARDGRAGQGR